MELENRIADSVLKRNGDPDEDPGKREEERYRNLDETIRSFQHNRQMVAATREKESHKNGFGFLNKKKIENKGSCLRNSLAFIKFLIIHLLR